MECLALPSIYVSNVLQFFYVVNMKVTLPSVRRDDMDDWTSYNFLVILITLFLTELVIHLMIVWESKQ